MGRWLPLAALLCTGCPSQRVMQVETRLLQQENADLQQRVHELEQRMPAAGSYERHPDLETVHRFLDRAGYVHTFTPGLDHIRMDFAGKNATFGLTVQHFESADVLFIGTDEYMHLDAAANTESLILLLVQIATLNYEMLLGKFQVNPENGEILLSVELNTVDGLAYDTFVESLQQLLHTADARYPELQRAAAGLGI